MTAAFNVIWCCHLELESGLHCIANFHLAYASLQGTFSVNACIADHTDEARCLFVQALYQCMQKQRM